MKFLGHLPIYLLALALMLTLLAPSGPRAAAQTPQPQAPGLAAENDPLSPSAGLAPAPQALSAPAASGGDVAFDPAAAAYSFAADDRYNTDPTNWVVYEHMSEASVNNLANQGYRMIDIQVEAFSPTYQFTVTMVVNSGTYQKAWWWYYNQTEAELNAKLNANSARLISLKAYDIGGGAMRFAAVMIANTGTDSTVWWWYYGKTVGEVTSLWQANHARLTQVHAYLTGGVTRYSVVMVDNTGANYRDWWWYVGQTINSVSTNLTNNNARLVDLDIDPAGTYNVIMAPCSGGCPLWWWYVGIPTSQLLNLVNQNGARMIDVNTVPGCGDACFSFLLINNSNAITSRVGQLLRNSTDGTKGLYLKQVGGPVLANLMDTTAFEPASTIKAAVHLETMRQLQNGSAALSTLINQYQPPVSSSCPGNTVIGTESIQLADREMMWHSDNTRTRELVDYFGVANINYLMNSIGMIHSSINHVIGCGGPTPNQTTLADLSLLYEGVANTSLLDAARRGLFFSQMAGKAEYQVEGYDWTGLWSTDIPALITQEAPAGMSAQIKNWFRGQMQLAYKAGNYKLCTSGGCATYIDHISIFGYAQIPFCSAGGPRQYVFGVFINNATSDANSSTAFTSTKAELLREQIHAGRASCASLSLKFVPLISR